MLKRITCIVFLLAFIALSGCFSRPADMLVIAAIEPTPNLPSPTASPVLTPVPTPAPTPEPQNEYATIGAVGDIMIMQSQIKGAWSSELLRYDFMPSFTRMQPYFNLVDVMCVNLETPLAGEAVEYSSPAPAKPTPDENGEVPFYNFQTFNAPDELATALYDAGVDVVTTANNHCLDRGVDGIYRTAQVLRDAGLTQVGTYLSPEDREQPRIIDVNGIKIGFLAWTNSVNSKDKMIPAEQQPYAVGRARESKAVKADIENCMRAGAEYIVAFLHWDEEFSHIPTSSTKKRAKELITWGVDAILGSHPHVVQPVEYITVEREGGEYTGIVAYSLGNYLSNMAPSPRDFGMFIKLTVEKTPEGSVSLYDAGMLPIHCIKHRVDGRTLHEVLPALHDESQHADDILSELKAKLSNAREHVIYYAGDIVPFM